MTPAFTLAPDPQPFKPKPKARKPKQSGDYALLQSLFGPGVARSGGGGGGRPKLDAPESPEVVLRISESGMEIFVARGRENEAVATAGPGDWPAVYNALRQLKADLPKERGITIDALDVNVGLVVAALEAVTALHPEWDPPEPIIASRLPALLVVDKPTEEKEVEVEEEPLIELFPVVRLLPRRRDEEAPG